MAVLYWDTNGSTPGLGGSGGWDLSSANWTTDPTGTSATQAWNNTTGDTAVFDGTAGTVTVASGIAADGITASVNGYGLQSGSIALAGGAVETASGASLTISSPLVGSGPLVKTGAGTLTLTGASTYTGSTTVSAGTLTLQNTYASAAHSIASGAVLELNVDSGTRDYGSTTFTGTGTLRKTGAGTAVWGTSTATFALGSGALIDVQQGAFFGGHYANENWTDNQAGLNVASGAEFNGWEANVRVGALTGAGVVRSGWDGAWYSTFTFGVGDASGTFAGTLSHFEGVAYAHYTKTGTGTQTFTGTINQIAGAGNAGLTIGGGTVEIGGAGTFAGGAWSNGIVNNGTFKYNSTATNTLGGAISGSGSVVKDGTGTLVLASSADYTGNTQVDAGTLVFQNTYASANHSIAAGAVLELNVASGTRDYGSTTFTGAGTLRKTGAGTAVWTTSVATFALGSGALIDVQEGKFLGGSNANENWTNNQAGLNVASGAEFNGVEANVRVGALSGAGIVRSGHSHESYSTFTFGVGNASGTFGGTLSHYDGSFYGNYTKTGTGTQTFTGTINQLAEAGNTGLTIAAGTIEISGAGTFSGDTWSNAIVNNGTFQYDSSANNTLSGTISGTGALVKDNTSTLTLSGANTYAGATTIDAGTLSYQSGNASTAHAIASGAVLELNVESGTRDYGSTVFTGSGTLRKTGAGTAVWTTSVATFALGSGALIEVQQGKFLGGSNANENWTNNQAGLNVASGAEFNGVEANVRVGALTGAGIVRSGHASAGYSTFTFGVGNASGTFGGTLSHYDGSSFGHYTKTGSGTQTFTGTINRIAEGYNVGLTIGSGTVEIGAAGTFAGGSFPNTINNNGTLKYNSTIDATLNGPIVGTGSLVKDNTSTLVLNGLNYYSGPTTVQNGTLEVNNFVMPSAVTLQPGTTLRGSGGTGPVTNNGGTQENNQGDRRYKVVMGSGGGEAAAVYTNVDVGIKNSGWITAGNWTTALQTALAGSSLRVNGTLFSYPVRFINSTVGALHGYQGNSIPGLPTYADDVKMLAFEDAFDFDVDDRYWSVGVAAGDVDADSDNSGTIDYATAEENVEDTNPGKLVAVALPGESVHAVPLDVKLIDFTASTSKVKFSGNANLFRLWTSDPGIVGTAVQIPFGTEYLASAGPVSFSSDAWRTFYVEALTPGSGAIGVSIDPLGDGQWVDIDSATFTGVLVDIDTDSDNQNGIDPDNNPATGDDDPIENDTNKPGRLLAVNDDDDNNDGILDLTAPPVGQPTLVTGENDLAEVVLRPLFTAPSFGQYAAKLIASGPIKLWHTADKTTPVEVDANTGIASWDLAGEGPPPSIWVEGLGSGSATIEYWLDGPGGSYLPHDLIKLSVVSVDLDVDSNNADGITENDDAIEDDPSRAGKAILANTLDSTGNGSPDFADGFDKFGNQGANRSVGFTQAIVSLASAIDLSKARVRFRFDESAPDAVTRNAGPNGDREAVYAPGSTNPLRLWLKDGTESREKADVAAGGDRLAESVWYDAAAVFGEEHVKTLFVEGINETALGAGRIIVDVNPTGYGNLVLTDAVRTTVGEIQMWYTDVSGITHQAAPGEPELEVPRIPSNVEPDGVAADWQEGVDDGATLLVSVLVSPILTQIAGSLSVAFGEVVPTGFRSLVAGNGTFYATYDTEFAPEGESRLQAMGLTASTHQPTGKQVLLQRFYRPPNEFDASHPENTDKERKANLAVNVSGLVTAHGSKPNAITLTRAPIVTVHGIGAKPTVWNEFVAAAEQSGFVANGFSVDHYSVIDSYRPSEGQTYGMGELTHMYELVREMIVGATAQFRYGSFFTGIGDQEHKRIAIQKADTVAHSYGGLLTRWYIEEADQQGALPDAGDEFETLRNVRKLVTLGTPHKGSPLANMTAEVYRNPLIASAYPAGDWTPLDQTMTLGESLQFIDIPAFGGATSESNPLRYNLAADFERDVRFSTSLNAERTRPRHAIQALTVNGERIEQLNNNGLASDVSYGAIIGTNNYLQIEKTTGGFDDYNPFEIQVPVWEPFTQFPRAYFPWLNTFTPASDGAVAKWSANLGDGSNNFEFNVNHSRLPKDDGIQNKVWQLLAGADPNMLLGRDIASVGPVPVSVRNAYEGSEVTADGTSFGGGLNPDAIITLDLPSATVGGRPDIFLLTPNAAGAGAHQVVLHGMAPLGSVVPGGTDNASIKANSGTTLHLLEDISTLNFNVAPDQLEGAASADYVAFSIDLGRVGRDLSGKLTGPDGREAIPQNNLQELYYTSDLLPNIAPPIYIDAQPFTTSPAPVPSPSNNLQIALSGLTELYRPNANVPLAPLAVRLYDDDGLFRTLLEEVVPAMPQNDVWDGLMIPYDVEIELSLDAVDHIAGSLGSSDENETDVFQWLAPKGIDLVLEKSPIVHIQKPE